MSLKHRILVCSGAGEPEYTTSKSFIRALRRTEHAVMTCGPSYCNDLRADIEIEDRQFPELYTYKEVLEKCKPFDPDIIIQIEPHFYLNGEKPLNIKSYYWILDAHRGGFAYRSLAEMGSFDAIFIAQKFFAPAFQRTIKNTYFLPQALDIGRIRYDESVVPECDIAYIGETGLADLVFDKVDKDGLQYTDTIPNGTKLMSPVYKEYGERAQLLKRLCRDFNVRIYKKNFVNYSKIIQKGRIGFQRSLFNDITLRLFEVLACKRALVCDYVPFLEEILIHKKHCIMYNTFGFNIDLDNFELDYEQAFDAVSLILQDNALREEIVNQGYEHVLKYHTFDNRVRDILRFNDK